MSAHVSLRFRVFPSRRASFARGAPGPCRAVIQINCAYFERDSSGSPQRQFRFQSAADKYECQGKYACTEVVRVPVAERGDWGWVNGETGGRGLSLVYTRLHLITISFLIYLISKILGARGFSAK